MIIINTYEQKIQEWEDNKRKIQDCEVQGILPSPPDPRDYDVDDLPLTTQQIPRKHILPESPIVLNQGSTSYCAGAAGAAIANAYYNQFNRMPRNGFSMTFLYWLAKQYDGIPNTNGTYLRTLLKMMKKYGCAPLDLVPYSRSRITITSQAIEEAKKYQIDSYARLNSISDIQKAIYNGNYVMFGTLVTRDNWNRAGGYLSKPAGSLYGGHATFSFGYDSDLLKEHEGYHICQNSWGESWGDRGKFYLPYDFHNMRHENRNVFLEAWAVHFEEQQSSILKPNIDIRNDFNNHAKDLQERIRQMIDRIRNRFTKE